MTKPIFKNVLLVGVGLIGGSLVVDLKKRGTIGKVFGYDLSKSSLRLAKKKKIIDESLDYFEKHRDPTGGTGARSPIARTKEHNGKPEVTGPFEWGFYDLIILSIPVRGIESFLKKWGEQISPNTLVMDVGSTKIKIMKLAKRHLPHGNFVGTHPMAGAEKSGVKAICENLFDGKTCFLLKSQNGKPKFYKKAKALWQCVGAKTVEIDTRLHDELMAGMSHIPHLVAFALVQSFQQQKKQELNSLLKKHAGGGFKDTTRIAASSPEMWRDIFLDNKENMLRGLKRLRKEMDQIEKYLKEDDEKKVYEWIQEASEFRKRIK